MRASVWQVESLCVFLHVIWPWTTETVAHTTERTPSDSTKRAREQPSPASSSASVPSSLSTTQRGRARTEAKVSAHFHFERPFRALLAVRVRVFPGLYCRRNDRRCSWFLIIRVDCVSMCNIFAQQSRHRTTRTLSAAMVAGTAQSNPQLGSYSSLEVAGRGERPCSCRGRGRTIRRACGPW